MDLIIPLLFFIFYTAFFASFLWKKATLFIIFLILIIFFYEFLFIQISDFVDDTVFYLIKSWQEYLFAIVLCFIFIKILIINTVKYSATDKRIFTILLLLTISGFAASLFQSVSIFDAFLGWRTYILPIFLNYLLYYSDHLFNSSTRAINYTLITFSCIMVLYASYLEASFNGDLTSLFFYDYVNEISPIEQGRYNYVRDDQLRATGFFVSPLIYSSFLGYTSLILLYYILFSKIKKRIWFFFLFVFILYGQYIARTRIGLVNFGVGIISTFLIYYKPYISLRKIVYIPIVLIVLTFIGLITGLTSDPSALGRLVQYTSIPDNFKVTGLGFGDPLTTVFFDSWYISALLLFGLLFPIYVYLHILLLKKIHPYVSFYKTDLVSIHEKVFFFANYGFFISFIYMFAFQYILGSATIYIFYIMIFLIISKNRYNMHLQLRN